MVAHCGVEQAECQQTGYLRTKQQYITEYWAILQLKVSHLPMQLLWRQTKITLSACILFVHDPGTLTCN